MPELNYDGYSGPTWVNLKPGERAAQWERQANELDSKAAALRRLADFELERAGGVCGCRGETDRCPLAIGLIDLSGRRCDCPCHGRRRRGSARSRCGQRPTSGRTS